MSTIEARLAQLQRISGLVLQLPPEDKASILSLLMPAATPAPVAAPAKRRGRPAGSGTGRVVMTKKWGAYRIRHKVTNALKGPYQRIGGDEHYAYREAMLAKHGAEWLAANAKRIGVRP